MRFFVKQEGKLTRTGIETDDGIEIFESSKYYHDVKAAFLDITKVTEMCRASEIIVYEKTSN